MNDKAIEYNAILQKVENTLEKMQKIGLNTSVYYKLLEEIKADLEKSKDNSFKNLFNSSMETDVLSMAYSNAIKRLDIMYTVLTKYDVYLKTAGFCGTLRAFLAESNKDKNELSKLSAKILELLDEIKKSDTLDYSVEGPLVEDIYHLTYEFIKIEISLTGTSSVLSKIEEDGIDKSYIEKEIIRELESLDLKNPKYREIVNKKHELESLGMRSSYVDKEFISIIVNCTISYEYLNNLLKRLVNEFNVYYNEAISIDNKIVAKMAELDEREKNRKQSLVDEYKEIGANVIKTIVSIGLIISLSVGAYKLSKMTSKKDKYKVTTTTYSSISLPVVEEEYLDSGSNSRFLYEYSPYTERKVLGGFGREVTEYDLTNLDDLTLEEYLSLDLNQLGIKGTKTKETKSELTLGDLYEESYYLLKETTIDETDIISEEENFIGYLVVNFVIGVVLDFLIECILDKIPGWECSSWAFIDGIKKIKKAYQEIKCQNHDVAHEKEELKKLLKEAKALMVENEELVLRIGEAIKTSDNEKQKATINTKLERIRKLHY
ncbi:MAG: hypothetical protein NC483_06235 [Ruminococcus sp.]|nr:hypothetical protein [Ruminococcus sp.]